MNTKMKTILGVTALAVVPLLSGSALAGPSSNVAYTVDTINMVKNAAANRIDFAVTKVVSDIETLRGMDHMRMTPLDRSRNISSITPPTISISIGNCQLYFDVPRW